MGRVFSTLAEVLTHARLDIPEGRDGPTVKRLDFTFDLAIAAEVAAAL